MGIAHCFQKGHFSAQFRQKRTKRSLNTLITGQHVLASEAVVEKITYKQAHLMVIDVFNLL